MGNNKLSNQLRSLASDATSKRSKAARLLDVVDDVEAALAAGVRRSAVVEKLAEHGLEMTLSTFDSSLRRIRQKRVNKSVTSVNSVN